MPFITIIHDFKIRLKFSLCPFHQYIAMLTLTLWQLLLSLSFTAHSLPDSNFGAQTSDISTSGSVVDNEIYPFSIDLATKEGANEIAQVPDEGNGMNLDASKFQGSGCPPDTNRLPTQRRIRRGNACSSNGLELNNGESGRQSAPATPKLQQNQQGQDSGGDGGSGQPRPNIILPKADDPLPAIFWPEERRPKKDPKRCYERGYLTPVCAKDSDALITPGSFDTYILDPCNPCMFFYLYFYYCSTLE